MKDPARVKSSLTTNVLAVCVGIALNVLGIAAYISYDQLTLSDRPFDGEIITHFVKYADC